MVWTEVSGLLAVVAALFLFVLLVAIVLSEMRGSRFGDGPAAEPRKLPDNADLRDEDRRSAMHRLAAKMEKATGRK